MNVASSPARLAPMPPYGVPASSAASAIATRAVASRPMITNKSDAGALAMPSAKEGTSSAMQAVAAKQA